MVILCLMNTGQLIRDALAKRKMSQVDLAQKINVTPAQVSRIISGERGASIDTLLLIADALGIERDLLLKVVSGLPINKGVNETDQWVEEMNHKITLFTPGMRPMAEKLLNALLEEDKPVIVHKKARAKT